jgi:hypothetical protein
LSNFAIGLGISPVFGPPKAGLLFDYEPGDPLSRVFSRGSGATYVDENGVVQTAATNVLRDGHYEGSDRHTLLEAGYTNLMTTKDLDSWTKVGTPTVTAITGPDGVVGSAFTVADDDGIGLEYIYSNVSFTGDADKAFKVTVRERTMPTSGTQKVIVYDNTAAAVRASLDISSWVGGEPQIVASGGALLDKWQIGATGWWVLEGEATAVVAANTNRIQINPANTATATGSIDVWFPQAYNAPFPPRSFLDASASLSADSLKFALDPRWTPGSGYTLYGKIKNFMLAGVGASRQVFSLGDFAVGTGAMYLEAKETTNFWRLVANTLGGGATVSTIGSSNAPTIGDDFEFRVSVPSTGDITWGVSKNGGAEATQTHTPGTWDAAFNSLFFHLSQSGAGTNQGNAGHMAWKAFPRPGVTLEECRLAVRG